MKTLRTGEAGGAKLKLVHMGPEFIAVAFEGNNEIARESAPDADEAWNALLAKLSRVGPNWFGYAGARARFLHWFAGGFQSQAYLDQEREYKFKAKTELEQTAPLEKAATDTGHGEAVLKAYRATNLLYPLEKTRLQGLLRGPDADAFVQSAARLALGEGKSALKAMEKLLRPLDNAKWTVVSYLPFLWRPGQHIFLKPEVTKDFAERVGHSFAQSYSAELDLGVYEDLLDMAEQIRLCLSDLQPRDMIDIQSLIWVLGSYRDGEEQPRP